MRLPLLLPVFLSAALTAHAASDPAGTPGPQNVLGYADEHGCLSLWRDFGNVNFSAGISIPLRIQFCSERVAAGQLPDSHTTFPPGRDFSFPYLGRGWLCPLLESRFTMQAYRPEVYVLLPTGKKLTLSPDPNAEKSAPDFAVLHSADGRWRGVLRGDSLVLTSDADDWELTFLNKRIQQWKIGGDILEWIYKGDLVSEIRLKATTGKAPFIVNLGPGGHPDGFIVNDRACHFKLTPFPPITQFYVTEPLPDAENVTLTEWTGPGDIHETFTFATIPGSKCTLTFNDQGISNTCTWFQFSRLLFVENDWHYMITPAHDPGDFCVILRENGKREYEYTSPDVRGTVIVARALNGDTTITTKLHRSAVPCEEIQKVEKAGDDGLYHLIYLADFDAAGNVTREFKVDGKGTATLTTFAGPGNIKTETLSGPDAIPAMRERLLLADVEKSGTPAGRDHALEQLAYLYITEGKFNKALALRPKITSRDIWYAICNDVATADKKLDDSISVMRDLLMGGSLPKPDNQDDATPPPK